MRDILRDWYWVVHYYYYILIFFLRVFHTSFSRWSFTRVWVIVSTLVSPNLLSNPVNLSNAVVWIILIRHLISVSLSPFPKPQRNVPSVLITIVIIVTLISTALLDLWQGPCACLFFRFLWFSVCCSPGRQRTFYSRFVFFNVIITRSGILTGIRWSVFILKFPENFMHLILQDGFLFAHVQFGTIVQYLLLAQFSVDHLHLVVSILMLSFC